MNISVFTPCDKYFTFGELLPEVKLEKIRYVGKNPESLPQEVRNFGATEGQWVDLILSRHQKGTGLGAKLKSEEFRSLSPEDKSKVVSHIWDSGEIPTKTKPKFAYTGNDPISIQKLKENGLYGRPIDSDDIKNSDYISYSNFRQRLSREGWADKIKEYQKEYYQNNADKIKEYKKEYYQNNADKVKERQKQLDRQRGLLKRYNLTLQQYNQIQSTAALAAFNAGQTLTSAQQAYLSPAQQTQYTAQQQQAALQAQYGTLAQQAQQAAMAQQAYGGLMSQGGYQGTQWQAPKWMFNGTMCSIIDFANQIWPEDCADKTHFILKWSE